MKSRKARSGMVENTSPASRIVDIAIMMILAVVVFICFVPMLHVFMASLSDGKLLLAHEGLLWLPLGGLNLEGYSLVFADTSILNGYANTLIYVVGAAFFGMTINILGGYVLSKSFKLKKLFTSLIVFTVLFNGGLVPTYMVIRSLDWVGTRWALLVPGCTNAIFVVLLMNAFRNVPVSTVEAAEIDGAGHIRTMIQVMLPQAQGLTVVVLLNSVIMQWNSWFPASIYVPNNRELWPLQLWIRQLTADNTGFLLNTNPDYSRYLVQYAVIIIATLPVLCAFPFFQKRLEASALIGGVKG